MRKSRRRKATRHSRMQKTAHLRAGAVHPHPQARDGDTRRVATYGAQARTALRGGGHWGVADDSGYSRPGRRMLYTYRGEGRDDDAGDNDRRWRCFGGPNKPGDIFGCNMVDEEEPEGGGWSRSRRSRSRKQPTR